MLTQDGRLVEAVDGQANSRVRQSGEWDRNLNCEECERMFGPWDKEGVRVLLHTDWPSTRKPLRQHAYYEVEDYSYPHLKLFFLGVLWRLGASDRELAGFIELGPRLEALRHMVLAGHPGTIDDFGVSAQKMVPKRHLELDPGIVIPTPQSERMPGGLRTVRLHFGGFEFVIKTDSRPWDPGVHPFLLGETPPWRLPEGAFEKGLAHWTAMRVFGGR